MKNLIIIMIFVLLILSCSETPTEPEIKYSGITETSSAGPEPIGNIDPDDWYYHPTSINEPVQYSVAPAYPNPATRGSTLSFVLPQLDTIKIWIHDPMRNKEAILFDQEFTSGYYSINLDFQYGDSTLTPIEGIVRVFIKFNNKEIPLIHGDIQIIK